MFKGMGAPGPRTTTIVECGWEGLNLYTGIIAGPSGYMCSGPLLEVNGTTYGSCYPEGNVCPL
ncbi:hypothetical protein BT96DRAFT_1010783 [Gymnopus androsaceus JB14]|uniref:Uncharacterized protein n=1 Tax=Gymnopus androsaceus JB14 TaxID=1447944 RepID=A0A6A4GA67_9AGAR|nr:hypothetical protein BT96DRAFT_1010783 [Gymnopus androsaceus JB14]